MCPAMGVRFGGEGFVSGPAPQREYRCGLNAVEAALTT